MKVGIVCPYALDVPGGVQHHVLELAEALLGLGLEVSVLAPADASTTALPAFVVPVRGAVAVPYNGSVARLAFGPVAVARTRRWLAEERLDVLHVHEPAVPSLSMLALWAADVPVVATFHAAMATGSRALAVVGPVLRPAWERIGARIAVSRTAMHTMQRHVGGAATIIPNGVWVNSFARARPDPRWASNDGTVVFLGRMDEPRKGLGVLLDAWPRVLASQPAAKLLVAGHGSAARVRSRIDAALPHGGSRTVQVLGRVGAADKAGLLAAADAFVAPHLGGESFGVVLVEAMAAGAAVVASDLPAFVDVLDGGTAGRLVPAGSPDGLAAGLVALLADPAARAAVAASAARVVAAYDWPVVARRMQAVYETVTGAGRTAGGRRSGVASAAGQAP